MYVMYSSNVKHNSSTLHHHHHHLFQEKKTHIAQNNNNHHSLSTQTQNDEPVFSFIHSKFDNFFFFCIQNNSCICGC